MLKQFLNLFRPRLGKVLAQFDRAVVELEKVQQYHNEEAQKQQEKAAKAQALAAANVATADRAATVRAIMKTLLGQ